ncbi:hypothetical protein F5B17DRAFT_453475 [Nemania serpens]|nr:hypothetical protein F5B17DRAFT_453475 [Nemania serpens]
MALFTFSNIDILLKVEELDLAIKMNDHMQYILWTPGSTSRPVDGEIVSLIQSQALKDASQVDTNTWSD